MHWRRDRMVHMSWPSECLTRQVCTFSPSLYVVLSVQLMLARPSFVHTAICPFTADSQESHHATRSSLFERILQVCLLATCHGNATLIVRSCFKFLNTLHMAISPAESLQCAVIADSKQHATMSCLLVKSAMDGSCTVQSLLTFLWASKGGIPQGTPPASGTHPHQASGRLSGLSR